VTTTPDSRPARAADGRFQAKPPQTPADPINAALDAADANLRTELVEARRRYDQTCENAWTGLLTLVEAAWRWEPGDDTSTCPIPVEAALRELNGTARHAIERATLTATPDRRYRLVPERVRIVEEARIPNFHDDQLRDCVRVNPARYLAARRLLSDTARLMGAAAVTWQHDTQTARTTHAVTCEPLLIALARQEYPHA
jgi:hypothetical protein